jgi:hypothetical protein
VAFETDTLSRDAVERRGLDERMSRSGVRVASKLIEGDKKHVHEAAIST